MRLRPFPSAEVVKLLGLFRNYFLLASGLSLFSLRVSVFAD